VDTIKMLIFRPTGELNCRG